MKAVSSKRKKTEADHAELSRLEWYAGLYTNENGQIIIPAENLEATFIAAAKKTKMGTVAKSAIWVNSDSVLIHPMAHCSVDEMWQSGSMVFRKAVKVSMAKVMRTRPIIKEWSCEVEIDYDQLQLNKQQLLGILNDAGKMVGIGDWRPRFGRFNVEEV